jgi:hypothetical protein
MRRGISLTNHRPGAVAYGELHEGWFYLGGDVLNVTLPTSPSAQLDVYGGIRPVWGPLTLDFGAVYHGRPVGNSDMRGSLYSIKAQQKWYDLGSDYKWLGATFINNSEIAVSKHGTWTKSFPSSP